MQNKAENTKLRRVKSHSKRRCPHCESNKWEWLGAVPTTMEELSRYLLVEYRCEKCGNKFLVEEAKKTRYVSIADKCIHCNSPDIERISKPDADIELFRCRKCNAYMAIGGSNTDGGPLVVDLRGQKVKRHKL